MIAICSSRLGTHDILEAQGERSLLAYLAASLAAAFIQLKAVLLVSVWATFHNGDLGH